MESEKDLLQTYYDEVIYLLKCGFHNTKYQLNENIDYKKLFAVARKHKVANLLFSVLKDAGLDKDVLKYFDNENKTIIAQVTMQEVYAEQLFNCLENAKIKYVPLKGWFIRPLYPKTMMRFSCDVDVLYDKDKKEQVAKIMEENGFKFIQSGPYDDEYTLGFVTIEMHHSLMSHDDLFQEYYKNVWDRFVRYKGEYAYRFNDEDDFVFMITHLVKHYLYGGTGIRSAFDVYVYLKAKNLDMDYVYGELDKLKLSDFTKELLTVTEKWFGDNCGEYNKAVATHLIESGIYGTKEMEFCYLNAVQSDRTTNGKLSKKKYYFNRIFPTYKQMSTRYKVLKKHAYLLPIFYVVRWFQAVFSKKDFKKEKDFVSSIDQEKVQKCRDILEKSKLI